MAFIDQWTVLHEYNDGDFDITVDMRPDHDTHPADCFDTSINPDTGEPYYNANEICEKIDDGTYHWFVLRATASINGRDLGACTIHGNLYEDLNDIFQDGVANDIIGEAVYEAEKFLADIRKA